MGDPIISMMAKPLGVDRMTASLVMCWLILGFDMSFNKAQRAPEVNWVGYVYYL